MIRRLLIAAVTLIAAGLLFLLVHPPIATTFDTVPCAVACHTSR
ncbi:MAG: hypothetical protein U0556_11985 [Dehalococcoidia bacterium]